MKKITNLTIFFVVMAFLLIGLTWQVHEAEIYAFGMDIEKLANLFKVFTVLLFFAIFLILIGNANQDPTKYTKEKMLKNIKPSNILVRAIRFINLTTGVIITVMLIYNGHMILGPIWLLINVFILISRTISKKNRKICEELLTQEN